MMNSTSHTVASDINLSPPSVVSNSPSPQLSPPNQRVLPIPAFYLYRSNGVAVPLIALDELPPWLRIGREDWHSSEWQQYMSLVNEQPTIRVGEYEVFAIRGGKVYQLPTWRVVGVWEDGHSVGAGIVWDEEKKGKRGGKGMYHLSQGEEYDHMADEKLMDNGLMDGAGRSPGFTGGRMSGNENAAGGQGREQIEAVNPEGVTQHLPNTHPPSATHLDNSACDDAGCEGFSYFDLPISSNRPSHHYPQQPQHQQYSLPSQQAAVLSTSPTWPIKPSRSLSNNSYSSAGYNHLYSLTSDTGTETSVSSLSFSDIPHIDFQVPTLPRVPLGLTQSVPPCFAWGMSTSNGQFTPWLENSAGGEGSVCSV
ncbi:hypothetical protein ACJ72_00629 [Emergomyces africanus]|uniref:Uncharacterized protein n=1 Tax=Emergomyces africanus TaxID=1955775 RepID=A0A1B7P7J8_9EURO|nr:hypothetical protein ACJ72_00629 [Emergomyces africanus]